MTTTDRSISAEEVRKIIMDCLFRDEEVIGGYPVVTPVFVGGVMRKFGFHPERLAAHASRIKEILLCLPDEFQQYKGGGMSFLNACMDASGQQWGEHINIEELFALGEAAGLCKSVLPRHMWDVLPGGMPYYVVTA